MFGIFFLGYGLRSFWEFGKLVQVAQDGKRYSVQYTM